MRCVVLQPSYIPWRGYFHQIHKADLFIFYDDVQYDRHGWRNRNRIKTPTGSKWLTIPVRSVGEQWRDTAICDIQTASDEQWARKHFETLRHNYRRAAYFSRYQPMLEQWYSSQALQLAAFTIETTIQLAFELGIRHTRFVRSSELGGEGTKTERLHALLKQVSATHYISGPAAKNYLELNRLESDGVEVEWMNYDYPEYPQLFPPFDPYVSALDLLFNAGPGAGRYIWDLQRG